MDANAAKAIADKIIGQVFGYQNPLSLEQIQAQFAFDVRLPQQVFDSLTNKPTWAQSTNPAKFVSFGFTFEQPEDYWMREKRPINSMQDIMNYWNETNYMATERYLDSLNVAESDNVRQSENVYRSQDVGNSKNILFTDGTIDSEYLMASQRSGVSTYCIRLEDSTQCSNSFNVSWSQKITNSLFIQDCSNLQDCMFCSHLNSKQYCIANMQFTEEEYKKIRDMVVRWILSGQ